MEMVAKTRIPMKTKMTITMGFLTNSMSALVVKQNGPRPKTTTETVMDVVMTTKTMITTMME